MWREKEKVIIWSGSSMFWDDVIHPNEMGDKKMDAVEAD